MHCKDCKHYDPEGFGPDCTHPLFQGGYGKLPEDREEDIKDRGIQFETDEGWGMIIGPNFGCIHFEAKDAGPARPTTDD